MMTRTDIMITEMLAWVVMEKKIVHWTLNACDNSLYYRVHGILPLPISQLLSPLSQVAQPDMIIIKLMYRVDLVKLSYQRKKYCIDSAYEWFMPFATMEHSTQGMPYFKRYTCSQWHSNVRYMLVSTVIIVCAAQNNSEKREIQGYYWSINFHCIDQ